MSIVKFNLSDTGKNKSSNFNYLNSYNSMPQLFNFNNSLNSFELKPVNYSLTIDSFNKMFNAYMKALNKKTSQMFKGVDFSNTSNSTPNTSIRLTGNLGTDIVNTAGKYINYSEADGSYKLFTQGRNEAWCADFVTHVVKEASNASGKSLPSGFGSSSVEGLRQWGLNNNCYLNTANKGNKKDLIAKNVKAGDVVIFKENGSSHTGIVSQVNSDGSIQTIEGNTSDKVAYKNYNANDTKISGFVQLA